MDGIHDLGGKQGFGTVEVEANEPTFHERWEAAVYTLTNRLLAQGMIKNVDQFRHAIERIDPIAYLTHSYYGRWLGGVETLLSECGFIDTDSLNAKVLEKGGDLSDRIAARPNPSSPALPDPESQGASRNVTTSPAFTVGQRVRTLSASASGHTRLPAYARGRTGTVVALQGGWVLPDSNASGEGECPQHLYSVRFRGSELWGDEAEDGQSVHLDLFESYLETSE